MGFPWGRAWLEQTRQPQRSPIPSSPAVHAPAPGTKGQGHDLVLSTKYRPSGSQCSSAFKYPETLPAETKTSLRHVLTLLTVGSLHSAAVRKPLGCISHPPGLRQQPTPTGLSAFKIMTIKLNKDTICLHKPFLPYLLVTRASPSPLFQQQKEGPQQGRSDVHRARQVGCTTGPHLTGSERSQQVLVWVKAPWCWANPHSRRTEPNMVCTTQAAGQGAEGAKSTCLFETLL